MKTQIRTATKKLKTKASNGAKAFKRYFVIAVLLIIGAQVACIFGGVYAHQLGYFGLDFRFGREPVMKTGHGQQMAEAPVRDFTVDDYAKLVAANNKPDKSIRQATPVAVAKAEPAPVAQPGRNPFHQ